MSNAENEGEAAAAAVPVDDSTELDSRAKVLDSIERLASRLRVATPEDVHADTSLPMSKVQAVLEDLESSERIVPRFLGGEEAGDERGWDLAGNVPPDQIPPLNRL